jgi:hypothetical protein
VSYISRNNPKRRFFGGFYRFLFISILAAALAAGLAWVWQVKTTSSGESLFVGGFPFPAHVGPSDLSSEPSAAIPEASSEPPVSSSAPAVSSVSFASESAAQTVSETASPSKAAASPSSSGSTAASSAGSVADQAGSD